METNVRQCMYCQCSSSKGCAICTNRVENGYYPYKLRKHTIAEYRQDVANGNIALKKAWEMLPLPYMLLFAAIVSDDFNAVLKILTKL